MVILIHPPVAKPCEPPAGIAKLSGILSEYRIKHHLLDANLEGLFHILQMPDSGEKAEDVWTKRAFRDIGKNISSLRDPGLYLHIDRYKRAVSDISRVLSTVSPSGTEIGLANYNQEGLSPLKSSDLLRAAEQPELNPFYPYFSLRLEGLFREKEASVAGISLNYLSQALSAFSMIGFIKRILPGVKVILGGGLVTSWSKNPDWRNPFAGLVDHFVSGPGEYQLLSLLGLNKTKGKSPKPDYLSLPCDKYLSPGFILPYSASTGCYWNRCDFCPEKAEGNPYIHVPVKQVLAELTLLKGETDPSLIHFLDNAISPALLEALCDNKLNIPWYGFVRISPHMLDPVFCMALKKAGCVMLKLGIESGDQGVLDALQKGINIEQASVVLKNLKRAGIATYVYLIFGTPVETEAGARKTLEFTVQHSKSIDFLNLAVFNMPACGTTAAGVKKREFYEGDLSLYTDFIHPSGWDRRRVRLFLENEFKKHPAISGILKKDPPIFTSNHAPFIIMRHSGREIKKIVFKRGMDD